MREGYCFECGRLRPLSGGICDACWDDRRVSGRVDANPVAAGYHALYAEAVAKLDRLLETKKERNHGR